MSTIPQIVFKSSNQGSNDGAEHLRLSDLFRRSVDGLDHDPFKPHQMKFNVLLWLASGNMIHHVDFDKFKLAANEILFIQSGQIHKFDTSARACEGSMLLCTDEFLLHYVHTNTIQQLTTQYRYLEKKQPRFTPVFTIGQVEQLLSNTKVATSTSAALWTLLIDELLSAQNYQQASLQQSAASIYHQFMHKVDKKYRQTRNASDYAHDLGITYKTLNLACKNYASKSAKQCIDQWVIMEAKRKLIAETQSVKEVAFSMGFDEPTNFLKYFKKQVNLTPEAFRRKYR